MKGESEIFIKLDAMRKNRRRFFIKIQKRNEFFRREGIFFFYRKVTMIINRFVRGDIFFLLYVIKEIF